MGGGSIGSPFPPPLGYTSVLCTFYLTIHCFYTSKQTHESQESLLVFTSCNQHVNQGCFRVTLFLVSNVYVCASVLQELSVFSHFCCLIVFSWCLFHAINVLMSLFKISFYPRQHTMHLDYLHPKPNLSMFCVLSQNYQQFSFGKIIWLSWSKLPETQKKSLKN